MSSYQANAVAFTCEEVDELAGVFVLDALEADERAVVAAHLASCTRSPHEEFAELGAVVPALATVAGQAGAPAALKRRVMEAYRRDMAASGVQPAARPVTDAIPAVAPRSADALPSPQRPRWITWVPAVAMVLVVAAVGAWGIGQAFDANQARSRAAALSEAIAALSQPGSSVAILEGSGPAAGASGFAAVTAEGRAHVVLIGLDEPPSGRAYQAWYIAGGTPTSAGVMTVGADGSVIMSDADPVVGAQIFAVTLEPSGGSDQPTSDPIVAGELFSPG